MLAYLATNSLISGESPVRAGNVGSTVVPTGVFEAADGIAPPFRLSAMPVANPRAAPTLGQHTAQVLSEVLGYDRTRLEALAETGVLGTTPRSSAAGN
jgi:crotonobetainyl-CoA:carnitine CoA-transferase CaiB-like acyl-CoA transferase